MSLEVLCSIVRKERIGDTVHYSQTIAVETRPGFYTGYGFAYDYFPGAGDFEMTKRAGSVIPKYLAEAFFNDSGLLREEHE